MKYIIQEDIKGETFVFNDYKNVMNITKILLDKGYGVNIKYIRDFGDFDTMTQAIKKVVSTPKPTESKIM